MKIIRLPMLLIWLALSWLPLVTRAQQSTAPKRVLVLYWYDKSFPGHVTWDRSFQATLKAVPGVIEYYPEYLEVNRFPGENQSQILSDYLRQKYADRTIDVLVAQNDASLIFLLKYRNDLFQHVPIVFSSMSGPLPGELQGETAVTGVVVFISYKRTLELALSLNPEVNQVFVISGSLERDKRFEVMAREQLRGFDGRIQINYLTDLSPHELIARTASMPERSIVLYAWQQARDDQGKLWETADILSSITQVTPVPIFGMSGPNVGRGIIGGHVYTVEAAAGKVAEMARRIANGEKAQDIPIEHVPTVPMFDWRELRRWKISEDSLPPGSVILFREFTFWEVYKWYIVGLVTACILEALLIAWLLFLRARRRQAELERARLAAVADAERRHLDEVVSNVPGIVWEARPDAITGTGKATFISEYVQRMLGYTAEEFLTIPGFGVSLVHEEDRERVIRNGDALARKGGSIQFRWIAKDGQVVWAEAHLTPILDEAGTAIGVRGVTLNITDRKEAEEQLRRAHDELNHLKNQLQAENIYLQQELQLDQTFGEIVGQSDPIRYVLSKIAQVAPTDSTVLISGETGTGKELVARAIHAAGVRRDRPLIKVNCAALSASLIESELFGHEKGAFTGAAARKLGRFELADRGTIFLDEIGELPLELQVKLLRVLQEGELDRVGGSKTIQVDVRVIAATNRNLKLEVDKGTFREDLWYRLNVFSITVPPLRQRKEDIPLLVDRFASKFAKRLGKTITSVSPRSMQRLQTHSWPGNVRELANVIERAVIHTQSSVLHLADSLEQAREESPAIMSLEEMERAYIIRTLENTGWRVEGPYGAAKLLGLNASTLRARMNKFGINRPRAAVAHGSDLS